MDIKDSLDNWQDLYDWTGEEIEEGARIAELKQSVSEMPDIDLSQALIESAYQNEIARPLLVDIHLFYGQFAYEYHFLNHSSLIKLLVKREMEELEKERIDLINKYGKQLIPVY